MNDPQRKLRVAFVSPEVHPFARTGGLGDAAGSLPAALARRGTECTVITPLYRSSRHGDLQHLARAPFVIGGVERQVEFLEGTIAGSGIRVIFIHSAPEFDRRGIYGEEGEDYGDNALRFGLFCQAAILACHRWCDPDIVHLHDWTTGLVPLYARTGDRWDDVLRRTRFVLTIHNLGYQGLFDPALLPLLGVDPALYHWEGIEFHGRLSFLKAGILYADLVTTVSPTYAREIQQPGLGNGLDGLLRSRGDRLVGIINGVDYGEWDPEKDPRIKRRFSPSRMLGKSTCKAELRRLLGLEKRKEAPLVGLVSRLVHQKGIDLLLEAAPRIFARGGQLAILGRGEPELERAVTRLAAAHPGACATRIGFDPELSHRVLAGADILPAPSRYEPCGLTHLYGMKYGVVPVARATGGLVDTVGDYDGPGGEGTGFLFPEATAADLADALDRALDLYTSPKKYRGRRLWNELRARAMTRDWSWDRAAGEYVDLYSRLATDKEVILARPEPGSDDTGARSPQARETRPENTRYPG